jgi:hypothetical protein
MYWFFLDVWYERYNINLDILCKYNINLDILCKYNINLDILCKYQ